MSSDIKVWQPARSAAATIMGHRWKPVTLGDDKSHLVSCDRDGSTVTSARIISRNTCVSGQDIRILRRRTLAVSLRT